jgi:hypothetical protein
MTWTVTVRIEVENDAFAMADSMEGAVAGVLRETADRLELEGLPHPTLAYAGMRIRDENGNTIGRLTYRDEPQKG